jgi:hypothetical protein
MIKITKFIIHRLIRDSTLLTPFIFDFFLLSIQINFKIIILIKKKITKKRLIINK